MISHFFHLLLDLSIFNVLFGWIIFIFILFLWLQVNELLYFFPTNDDSEVRFIWGSEETGFRHLYLVTAYVSGLSNGVEETIDRMESEQLYSTFLSSTLHFVRSKVN